jgi:hypothetical protein
MPEGMPRHYATANVARLVDAANSVSHTRDRTTLVAVADGCKTCAEMKTRKSHAQKKNSLEAEASKLLI